LFFQNVKNVDSKQFSEYYEISRITESFEYKITIDFAILFNNIGSAGGQIFWFKYLKHTAFTLFQHK